MKRRWAAAAALCSALIGTTARADETAKRPLPDYDGRAPVKPSSAWWVPRIALFPLWVVSELAVRKPLRAVVLVFDRNAADGESTIDRFDIRPVIIADYGFKPRFGAQVIGRTGDHAFRILADTFGAQSYSLVGAAWTSLQGGNAAVGVYSSLLRRPDTIFHGFGPESSPDTRTRIALERGETAVRFNANPAPIFEFEGAVAVRGVHFRDNEPTLPPNLTRDYVAFAQRVLAALDSRPIRPVGISMKQALERGNGVRLEGDAELAAAPQPSRTWTSYGATLLGSIDVTGTGRVLELSTTARFMDPLSGSAPSYLEHVGLGGDRYLRGHLQGRLFGRSAFVSSLQWRWPVWTWLDGFVQVDAGNVFDAHLSGISPKLFRLSATTGIRNVGTSGYLFELLGGVGTEPIRDGAHVSSVRVLLSASRAY
jgi:hypothetical protein